jgi:hypothetical protein
MFQDYAYLEVQYLTENWKQPSTGFKLMVWAKSIQGMEGGHLKELGKVTCTDAGRCKLSYKRRGQSSMYIFYLYLY